MSVEEMLAAARSEKGGGATAPAKPKAKPDKTAATPPSAAAKADPKKMSVEEMLAAARAEKSGGAQSKAPAAEAEPVAEPEPAAPAEEPAVTADDAVPAKGDVPTDTAGIVEYCRKTDSN